MNPTSAETEPTKLSALLPESTDPKSQDDASTWTAEEQAEARAVQTQRRLQDGWSVASTPGLMLKGEGRAKVESRTTALMPSRSGARDYNPGRDAFALRLGAELEGPNRYRFLETLLLDANGACRDESECPECGSTLPIERRDDGQVKSGGEYRFMVPDGNGGWRPCSACVSEQELGDIRQKAAAQQAARNARGGRR